MEKILIYPYNIMYKSYVKENRFSEEYRFEALVSPKGWGLEKDMVIGDEENSYIVENDFTEQLKRCSMVWFVEDDIRRLPEEIVFEKLNEAINAHKKILFTRKKDIKQYEKAIRMIPKCQLINENVVNFKEEKNDTGEFLYRIEAPVIVVFGIGEHTEKFDVQFNLGKKLREKGYKVSNVTSRRDSEIVGLHSLPEFLFNKNMQMRDKILAYNHYVKQLELEEAPDIFVIGVPGGVVPFDEYVDNHFGEMAYMISYAVPCDVAIMCIPYCGEYNENYVELNKSMWEKFRWKTVACHMSSTAQDLMTYWEEHTMKYLTIGKRLYNEKIKILEEKDIYNMLSEQGAEQVVERICSLLSD